MIILNIVIVLLGFVAALILLQTLCFKLSAHTESVELFKKLGFEHWR
jgi:hypothetical protein